MRIKKNGLQTTIHVRAIQLQIISAIGGFLFLSRLPCFIFKQFIAQPLKYISTMTVTYTREIATAGFSGFLKLLARWRGSIYQLLWKDFIIFVALYYLLALIYMFALDELQRKNFEHVARYCEKNDKLMTTVAFVLGFFVTQVMSRWWSTLGRIPWPDRMAMFVTANVHGLEEECRAVRRTLLRYFNLAYVLAMSRICPPVRKRFPTLEHMITAGILTETESELLLELCGRASKTATAPSSESMYIEPNLFCAPLAWAASLLGEARLKKWIRDDCSLKSLVDEINEYRGHLHTLFVYDTITLPLVYTQVVTIAVYMFFLACLMGRQFLADDPNNVYIPLFTFLEFFFYMGWLKVAECLANPFGEDADDFDINMLIDRNLQVSYMLVDAAHSQRPALIKDVFWDQQPTDIEMPYTPASEPFRIKNPNMGSAIDLSIPELKVLTDSSRDLLASIPEENSSTCNTKQSRQQHGRFKMKSQLSRALSIETYRLHSEKNSHPVRKTSFGRSNTIHHSEEFNNGNSADVIVGTFPKGPFNRTTSHDLNADNSQTPGEPPPTENVCIPTSINPSSQTLTNQTSQDSDGEVRGQEVKPFLLKISSSNRRSKFKSNPDTFSLQINDTFTKTPDPISDDPASSRDLPLSRDQVSSRDVLSDVRASLHMSNGEGSGGNVSLEDTCCDYVSENNDARLSRVETISISDKYGQFKGT